MFFYIVAAAAAVAAALACCDCWYISFLLLVNKKNSLRDFVTRVSQKKALFELIWMSFTTENWQRQRISFPQKLIECVRVWCAVADETH